MLLISYFVYPIPYTLLVQAVLLMSYFVLYVTTLRRGFRLLQRESYSGYLDANIRIRLQVGRRYERGLALGPRTEP